jgi:hypothetical protein
MTSHDDKPPGRVRDRAQMGSLLLEFGCPLFVCHISAPGSVSRVKA